MKFKPIIKGIFFDVKAIKELKISLGQGILAMLLSTFILVLPTDVAEFSFSSWLQNFLVVFIGLFFVASLTFLFSKALKSTTRYERFLSVANVLFATSLLIVSVPLLLLVNWVFNLKTLGTVLFSLVPYYNFIVFGVACEIVSRLKKIRATIIALIAMTLIFLFYYLLRFITI